nr:MAG TPA: hypothetical protein [Caudoviricetes sp.]
MWGGSGILRVTAPFGKKPCTGRTRHKQRQGIFYTKNGTFSHAMFCTFSGLLFSPKRVNM